MGGRGSEFTRGHDHLSCVPPQSSFVPPTTRNGSRSGGEQTRGCFRQRQRRELRPNTRGDNRRAAGKNHLRFISMAFFGGVYVTINMNTFKMLKGRLLRVVRGSGGGVIPDGSVGFATRFAYTYACVCAPQFAGNSVCGTSHLERGEPNPFPEILAM